MDKSKNFYLGGGSSLPFIKQRVCRNTTGAVRLGCVNMDSALAMSGREGGTLRLRELSGRPTLDWPIPLPDRDPRGIAMGKGFECWKKAREGKTGVSGNWYSIKTGGMQACHSLLEARLRSYFDMCPFVVECRTQYPSWDRDEYERYFLAGKGFPKTKVMTIDFMLTLSLPGLPYLLYHGVSAKPRALIPETKTVARHERETSDISKWGGTHEVMDEFTVPDTEYRNHLLLKSWFLWTDIEGNMNSAFNLAFAIKQSKTQGPLDRVLPMVGKRLGFDRDESYGLFGVAVFLGYLWLDHTYSLGIKEPLILLP